MSLSYRLPLSLASAVVRETLLCLFSMVEYDGGCRYGEPYHNKLGGSHLHVDLDVVPFVIPCFHDDGRGQIEDLMSGTPEYFAFRACDYMCRHVI